MSPEDILISVTILLMIQCLFILYYIIKNKKVYNKTFAESISTDKLLKDSIKNSKYTSGFSCHVQYVKIKDDTNKTITNIYKDHKPISSLITDENSPIIINLNDYIDSDHNSFFITCTHNIDKNPKISISG